MKRNKKIKVMKNFNRSEITKKAWEMYKKGIINFSGCMKWAWGVAKFEKLQLEKRAEALVKINEANNPKQSTSIISIDDNILIGRAVAEAFQMKSYFR